MRFLRGQTGSQLHLQRDMHPTVVQIPLPRRLIREQNCVHGRKIAVRSNLIADRSRNGQYLVRFGWEIAHGSSLPDCSCGSSSRSMHSRSQLRMRFNERQTLV